jgi:hypothetical protein
LYGAAVTGAAVTGAADGAVVAAALHAAKMIADAAARTARRDHHLVEWDMLASPPQPPRRSGRVSRTRAQATPCGDERVSRECREA